ncbi:MAG: hypothetical protein HN757_18405 [Calditrichaeota bacterium]|nr:hypothetical protein [Calditrichota bacterium]
MIVIKGAYLSETVYPRNCLRPMGDVDILALESDIIRTHEKLLLMSHTQS